MTATRKKSIQEIKELTIEGKQPLSATEKSVNVNVKKITGNGNQEPQSESADVVAIMQKSIVAALGETLAEHYKQIQQTIDQAQNSTTENVQAAIQPLTQRLEILEQAKEQSDTAVTETNKQITEANKQITDLTAAIQQKSETLAKVQKQLDEKAKVQERVQESLGIQGTAMVNTKFGGSDKLSGLIAEAFQEFDGLDKLNKVSESGEITCHDPFKWDEYVKQYGSPSPSNKLMKAYDEWGKKQGWFAGKNVNQAATVATDIPGAYLATLSAWMRMTHRPGHIFWQFPTTKVDFRAGIGDTIKVPRFAYLTSSSTMSDYELSGVGTYADLVTTADNLSSGEISLILKEYGRGKVGASTAISPVVIPSFVAYTSAYELFSVLDRNLALDYTKFEDKMIRSLWSATSRILYNDNDTITTTPANVGTGDKGTFTRKFAKALVSYLWINQFEPFPDNTYVYVHTPKSWEQYSNELDLRWQAPNEVALRNLTNILNPTVIPPEDWARVSGYMGLYDNLHHFVSNSYGIGAAGTEGVQNTTLGVGATLTRTGYAVGRDTIARAIAMPYELRESEITNFQRKRSITWLSGECFGALDVDPTGYSDASAVPQQLRVVQVRTTDTAV